MTEIVKKIQSNKVYWLAPPNTRQIENPATKQDVQTTNIFIFNG